LVLPQLKSSQDAITIYQEYHIYIFFGDAYYYENNYRNAEVRFNLVVNSTSTSKLIFDIVSLLSFFGVCLTYLEVLPNGA